MIGINMPDKRLQRTRDAYPMLDISFPEIKGVYQKKDDGTEQPLKIVEIYRTPDGLHIVVV